MEVHENVGESFKCIYERRASIYWKELIVKYPVYKGIGFLKKYGIKTFTGEVLRYFADTLASETHYTIKI